MLKLWGDLPRLWGDLPRLSRRGKPHGTSKRTAGVLWVDETPRLPAKLRGSGVGRRVARLMRRRQQEFRFACQVATPDNPSTLPISDDNSPIDSNMEPEAGPLKIFNWNDYLWPKVAKDFGKDTGSTSRSRLLTT